MSTGTDTSRLYLVGFRIEPDIAAPQMYTIYVDDDRPILCDNQPILFPKPELAEVALCKSNCGASLLGPAPTELYAVFDIANAFYSLIERDEDDFVAGGDAAVPGAVEGDKEAVVALGELAGSVEGKTKWGRVGLHFDERLYYSVAVAGVPEVGINDIASMAKGPAVVASVVESVNCLRWGVIAQEIASHVSDPDLIVPGVDSHADGVA